VSIHLATGHPVFVAFDAGNLQAVAQVLREKLASAQIIICADNDYSKKENTGVIAGSAAARAVSGTLTYPVFIDETSELSDFNDLYQHNGLAEVTRQISEAMSIPNFPAVAESNGTVTPINSDIYKIMSRAGDLKSLDIRIEYVVEGLIPEGMITVFYARSGMGKSTLLTQLCAAVSMGQRFMGLQVQQRECIYLDYENGLAVIVERLKKVQAADDAPFYIWHPSSEPTPPPLDKKDFDRLAEIHPGSLVVVDTLKACNDADENKANEMKPIFDKLKELRRQGLTVIVLHHTAKGNDGKFRGSSVIQDQADHCLVLHKVKQPGSDAELDDDDDVSTYRLGTKFKTRARPYRIFLEFDKTTELFKRSDDPANETLRNLQRLIHELNRYGEPTQKVVIDAVKFDETLEQLGRDAIRSLLRKGDGVFWQTVRRPAMKNALVYLPKSAFEHSAPSIGSECSNADQIDCCLNGKLDTGDCNQTITNNEFASVSADMPESSQTAPIG
jgi:hypothetical protein